MLWTSCMLLVSSHVFWAVLLPAMTNYPNHWLVKTTIWAQKPQKCYISSKIWRPCQGKDSVRSGSHDSERYQYTTGQTQGTRGTHKYNADTVDCQFTFYFLHSKWSIITNTIPSEAIAAIFITHNTCYNLPPLLPLYSSAWFRPGRTCVEQWGHTAI